MKNDIHTYPKGTRLAFDENISDRRIGSYARSGCVIVYVSPQGTPDETWVEMAWQLGAHVCISSDLDVPNIIQKEGYDMEWREP